LNRNKYLSIQSLIKDIYELNGIEAYVSYPNNLKSNSIPHARIIKPDNPKNNTVFRSIIPISNNRLIHILLIDNKPNNSIRRRTKLSNQKNNDSMNTNETSYRFLPIYKNAKWNLDPINNSNKQYIFSLSSKNHSIVVNNPMSIA
jgi:hypothetical protein